MDKYNLGVIQSGFSKTVLYDGGRITSAGTYALSDSVYNYKLIIVEHVRGNDSDNIYRQTNVIIANTGPPIVNAYIATISSDNNAPIYGIRFNTNIKHIDSAIKRLWS